MTAIDPALQAWIDAQLAVAPPPPPEAVALFARTFGPTTTDAVSASDAA